MSGASTFIADNDVSSSVARGIKAAATGIAAFVGRALRGPTDADGPVLVNSFAEFERLFGGLWNLSPMSFAVQDFFQNGGAQAVIIRLYKAAGTQETASARAQLNLEGLHLVAANPGAWTNELRARVDHATHSLQPMEDREKVFNLFVRDGATGIIEEFPNVSVEAGHTRQVDLVLTRESSLVRMTKSLPISRPAASADPNPGNDPWGDHIPATNTRVQHNVATDGLALSADDYIGNGKEAAREGLYNLQRADLFNILCLAPPTLGSDIEPSVISRAAILCEERRAMLLVDPPSAWKTFSEAIGDQSAGPATGIAGFGPRSKNAALYFPRLRKSNPLRGDQFENFVPCGAVAGTFARNDAHHGVWHAPAGPTAALTGVSDLSVQLTDSQIAQLNPLGINCLRHLPAVGYVVWGSRTLLRADQLNSEWKYIPVRRVTLFIEESLYRGTKWAAFEPNDEPLWSQIRLSVGNFMQDLFRRGAFQGSSPREAFFVKCDKETTTQNDIDRGTLTFFVGFAPLRPAEFVIIQIQQQAGRMQTGE